jgi:Carbohydrate binding domain/Tetratricopeptide repeat
MQLELRNAAKKWSALLAFFLMATLYTVLATAQVLAAYLSESDDARWIELAVRLDPGNAEARHSLGRFELLASQSPQTALPWLRSAAQLDPHNGSYWADLALTQQSNGDLDSAKNSLAHALAVDPHTPQIAWNAGNLYLAQGASDEAMKQFHTVLENDPDLTSPAIQTCWKIRPDIDYLLGNVVPPNVYSQFLEFLTSKEETAAAAKVWQQMFSLQQMVPQAQIFGYVRYLVLHHEAGQAARVWQESAAMAGLQSYQPSPENLLVNGDFSLDILNGGFEWVHRKTEGVSLALDPNQAHSSSRSLRISFDGPGIYDAGISQVIAVEPKTSYEFSAFYKAEDMDGAGGMEFEIQDAYKPTSFLMSEDLRDADFWKKTGGSFTTGPDTQLLIVHIVRVPAGSPIKGRLWIDGLQLAQSNNAGASTNVAESTAGEPQ